MSGEFANGRSEPESEVQTSDSLSAAEFLNGWRNLRASSGQVRKQWPARRFFVAYLINSTPEIDSCGSITEMEIYDVSDSEVDQIKNSAAETSQDADSGLEMAQKPINVRAMVGKYGGSRAYQSFQLSPNGALRRLIYRNPETKVFFAKAEVEPKIRGFIAE